ncbi:MAG TPA: bacillithiol biosynthesis BshC, partial [Vicinamibacteria bacterium]|nr:bacillithiol biosynthesis BshC [Vicinamibacteria bacterium]
MSEPASETLAYESLDQPLSPLFLDYLSGRERALPFLGKGGFGLDAILAAAERTAGATHPRAEVARALVRQQEARSSPAAVERARALAEPGSVAVVTGQQAGLFGGPLFVLLKAIATVEVARLLQEEWRRPVVPVFWVASDDHDFAVVRSIGVLDTGFTLRTLR